MNTITFLGTGGARVLVFKQILASGGLWLDLEGTQISLDPGPGALIQALKRKLDPTRLSAIVLSHRHLDHSADVNVMIEAMTEGCLQRRGTLFAPQDALDDDPVVLRYLRNYVEAITVLEEGASCELGPIRFQVPLRHRHGTVETYGLILESGERVISYIADTRYFPELAQAYRGDLLILHVVRLEPSRFDHLCLPEAQTLIEAIRPRAAIITHFGMTVWRAKPWELARKMTEDTGINVIAAWDGMQFDLETLSPVPRRGRK